MADDAWLKQPWMWPWLMAAQMGRAGLDAASAVLGPHERSAQPQEPAWTTPAECLLDLPVMRLHRFSEGTGPPVLIVTPLALHGPLVADLAPGHSLVERLVAEDVGQVALLSWPSATPDRRGTAIDDHLAHLLVAVEELGGRVRLAGICQGGVLALMFAARYPEKVERLVCAGAPVDMEAGPSALTAAALACPQQTLDAMIEAGGGIVRGEAMLRFWQMGGLDALSGGVPADILQSRSPPAELLARLSEWNAWVVDLPGGYLRQVAGELFHANKLARGEFVALGRRIAPGDVCAPLLLLAGAADTVAPPAQVFAAARLVGTPREEIVKIRTGGGHLSLFMGARTLSGPWRRIARWLKGEGV